MAKLILTYEFARNGAGSIGVEIDGEKVDIKDVLEIYFASMPHEEAGTSLFLIPKMEAEPTKSNRIVELARRFEF